MTACLPPELAKQARDDSGSLTLACPQGQQREEREPGERLVIN